MALRKHIEKCFVLILTLTISLFQTEIEGSYNIHVNLYLIKTFPSPQLKHGFVFGVTFNCLGVWSSATVRESMCSAKETKKGVGFLLDSEETL